MPRQKTLAPARNPNPRRWWTIVAIDAALVACASVAPVGDGFSVGGWDKLAHLGEYLLLAFLCALAWQASRVRSSLWRAWLTATLYGACLELVQLNVPWRSGDWGDVFFNGVGAALGIGMAQTFLAFRAHATVLDVSPAPQPPSSAV